MLAFLQEGFLSSDVPIKQTSHVGNPALTLTFLAQSSDSCQTLNGTENRAEDDGRFDDKVVSRC